MSKEEKRALWEARIQQFQTSVSTRLYLYKQSFQYTPLCDILKRNGGDFMARPKVYIIKLTDDEYSKLNQTIRNKSTCKTVLKRCQILRDLDEKHGTGLTHSQIAHTYVTASKQGVYTITPLS